MTKFTEHETAVLNYVQQSVPLVEQPFGVIGSELGIPEDEVQRVISDLKKRHIIRNVAGIFNGGTLSREMGIPAVCHDSRENEARTE